MQKHVSIHKKQQGLGSNSWLFASPLPWFSPHLLCATDSSPIRYVLVVGAPASGIGANGRAIVFKGRGSQLFASVGTISTANIETALIITINHCSGIFGSSHTSCQRTISSNAIKAVFANGC